MTDVDGQARHGKGPHMKRATRTRPPGIVVKMAPKRLVDHRAMLGTVVIDRVYNRRLGRFEGREDVSSIEGNFYLEPEEDRPSLADGRLDAVTAVVGATFKAGSTRYLRRQLHHGQALCAIVQVPTPAWADPVSSYFRAAFGDRWIQRVNHGSGQTEFQDRSGSFEVSRVLSTGQSVVGISADVRLLPRTLVGAADLILRLAPPNSAVVKAAISSFASRAPVELEDSIVAGLDLDDIVAAFRPGSGPQRIAQRLAAAAAALRMNCSLEKEKQS
jgi:hypothetical protein